MNDSLKKTITPVLALALALTLLAGCGVFTLTEEERGELEAEEVAAAQSIGQELAATYAADRVFSLNCVSDSPFNPYRTTSAWNKVVAMLVYENLVEQDRSFEAQPNLITAWETEDGKTWIFSVDTSRSFHDGGSMTAADAVYSLDLARGYESQYETRFRHVRDTYTLDSEQFVVVLSQVNWRFYELMDIPCIEYGTGYTDRPPGTGPYTFSASGRYLRLDSAHPLAAQMPLTTIYLKEYGAAVDILQAFEDSYLDLVINDPNGISSMGYSSTNIIKYVDTTSLHYIGYNVTSGLFAQGMLRSVMTYGIDRASIVSEVMQGAGTAAVFPISPQSELYPEALAKTLAYTESGFRTALENLGATDLDLDGTLEFSGQRYTVDFIVCSDSGVKVSIARAIASSLRGFGIDVSLRELGYDDYIKELEKGSFDMYYAEVRLCGDWDLRYLLESGAELNYGNVRDAALDGYLQDFISSPPEQQADRMEQLCRYIAQSAPITPICFEKSQVLYHRGVLSGLEPTQDNVFHNMQNWTVELTV